MFCYKYNIIKPNIKNGKWVISERFIWSSLAYQGSGRMLNLKYIKTLSQLILNSLKPDLIIYLDIKPKTSMKRIKKRGSLDRIEKEKLQFFERIRSNFIKLTQHTNNSVLIDASQSKKSVDKNIIQNIKNLL